MTSFLLAPAALAVGFLCGCTSVGGILLIPALTAIADLEVHTAMATAMFSLFFPSLIGTGMYARHKALDLRLAVPLCLGSLPCSYFGALMKQHLGAGPLTLILALLIVLTGLNTLTPGRSRLRNAAAAPWAVRGTALLLLGGGVGFLAGLTGVGGPVVSVPVMIILGFSPLASVAVAQPFQLMATAAGSLSNLRLGLVDFSLVTPLIICQCVGMAAGIRVAHLLNTEKLKLAVALTCIGTGLYLLIREAFVLLAL